MDMVGKHSVDMDMVGLHRMRTRRETKKMDMDGGNERWMSSSTITGQID